MRNLFAALALSIFIFWDYDPNTFDVLEQADTPSGPWLPVYGPYDRRGSENFVEYYDVGQIKFWRVKRIPLDSLAD